MSEISKADLQEYMERVQNHESNLKPPTHKEYLQEKINNIDVQIKDVEYKFLTARIVRDTNVRILSQLKESMINQLGRGNDDVESIQKETT